MITKHCEDANFYQIVYSWLVRILVNCVRVTLVGVWNWMQGSGLSQITPNNLCFWFRSILKVDFFFLLFVFLEHVMIRWVLPFFWKTKIRIHLWANFHTKFGHEDKSFILVAQKNMYDEE